MIAIPADLVAYVMGFLTIEEILTLSETSQECFATSSLDSIWERFLYRDFLALPRFRHEERYQPKKNLYIQAMRYHRYLRPNFRRIHFQTHNTRIISTIKYFEIGLQFCFVPLCSLSLVWAPFVTFVFLACWLDNRLKWPIWLVLSPLWVLYGLFTFFIILALVLRSKDHSRSFLFNGLFSNLNGFLITCIRDTLRNDIRVIVPFVLTLSVVPLQSIIVAAKCNGDMAITWTAAFCPLWLTYWLWLLWPLTGMFPPNARQIWTFVLFFGCPLILTSFLLCFKLSGSSIGLEIVFIPLWVFDFLSLLALIYLLACSLMSHDVADTSSNIHHYWFIYLGLLMFKVFLCIYDHNGNGTISPLEVFFPLLSILSMATVWSIEYIQRNPRSERALDSLYGVTLQT